MFNQQGVWLKYFADGDVVFSNVSLTGLSIGAPTSVALANATTNDFDLSGGAFFGNMMFALTGGGSSAIVTGIDSADAVEGTLAIVVNETTVPYLLSVEDSGSAAKNRIDCQGAGAGVGVSVPPKGVVCLRYTDPPTGRWRVAWTNFALDFTSKDLNLSAFAGVEVGGAHHTLGFAKWVTGASTDPIAFPVPLVVGRMITGWSIFCKKTSSAAATISATLWRLNLQSGSATQIGSSATNAANNPGLITLSISGLTEVALFGYAYYLKWEPLSGAASDEVYGVQVVHTSTTGA